MTECRGVKSCDSWGCFPWFILALVLINLFNRLDEIEALIKGLGG